MVVFWVAMTSIKDAIKNWEAKEAKKAADAGLPEPPKAPNAERVMLYERSVAPY